MYQNDSHKSRQVRVDLRYVTSMDSYTMFLLIQHFLVAELRAIKRWSLKNETLECPDNMDD